MSSIRYLVEYCEDAELDDDGGFIADTEQMVELPCLTLEMAHHKARQILERGEDFFGAPHVVTLEWGWDDDLELWVWGETKREEVS